MTATRDKGGDSSGPKPVVVLSGVTLRESGSLVIFTDALGSLERTYSDRYEIVALVKSRDLFDTPRVTYMEFPHIMHSWLARLWFEYWSARGISARLKPRLWLSLHETTPNVVADIRAVYCHNVSEFYRITPYEFLLDWRFGMFTFFYRFIHSINIRKNRFVVVQADWIRKRFERTYGIRNIVVAPPDLGDITPPVTVSATKESAPFRFFYPFYPRPYKNPEICLEAARILEHNGFRNFELWLTMDASTNKYAARVNKKYSEVGSVRWLGKVSRERVQELYAEADCLLFPSKLETWGLPLSEFRPFGKPMLLADLPYAHEACARYERVRFFDPTDTEALADLMLRAAQLEPIFSPAPDLVVEPPFARDWHELWKILLEQK